jgi:hypothetical protein
MSSSFDDVLRVRVPVSLNERLKRTASAYARSPSDVVREAVVIQLNRLGRRAPPTEVPTTPHDLPPVAA